MTKKEDKRKIFKVSKENKQIINEFIEDYRKTNQNISKGTIRSDLNLLNKVAHHFKDKNLKDATEEELKNFFKNISDYGGYNLLGIKLRLFYRWVDNKNIKQYNNSHKDKKRILGRRQCPERMLWFVSKKIKSIDVHEIKKEIITNEEYKIILENSGHDRYGMWQALWETYWFSGARLGEVVSMKIKDVQLKDGRCGIYVPESKTKTREIPFVSYPFLLERWVHNHPNKNNPEAPLWISCSPNNFGGKLRKQSIVLKFWKLRKTIPIKQNLSVHNFRKTRATSMFNKRSKDGGLIYSDKDLALFFGWSLKQVSARREQYDLTGYDDLKNIVFNQEKTSVQDYDIVKKENERLKNNYEAEIKNLKENYEELRKDFLKAIGKEQYI